MNSRFSKSLPLWESRGLRFISSILVFLAVFFSNGRAAYAQNDKVTVDTKKSVSLVELFKMIEKSSDYLFQYKDGDVAGWTVNLSLKDVDGELLIISQFTLFASTKKGNRPSFTEAGAPDFSKDMYLKFIAACRDCGIHTEEGEFGAHMMVSLVNDGPVTITMDSKQKH